MVERNTVNIFISVRFTLKAVICVDYLDALDKSDLFIAQKESMLVFLKVLKSF